LPHPFEVDSDYLLAHLDDLVDVTFADIQSQFLVMPKGNNFIEFADFQDAYEVLKQETGAFAQFTDATVWNAFRRDALTFVVLRTILGLSPPEWAEIARSERNVDVPPGVARVYDAKCRANRTLFARVSALAQTRLDGFHGDGLKEQQNIEH
jgi:hypothetical protein